MNIFILLTFFIVLIGIELIYFKIANRYNIIDRPNHRSSHIQITIRGGGIIFPISLLFGAIFYGWQYIYFLLGLSLISSISFIDDVRSASNKVRILCHLIAVSLMFYQLNIFSLPVYIIALALIFVIGTINAINFMDGINGITGLYNLVVLTALYYINRYIIVFTTDILLILSIISIFVFNFFNFRKRAKCFAGDVGSVSLAFILVFFLLQLIVTTNNLNYVLLLLVYGLDTSITIFFRIIKGENIFKAHRMHFYQFLVNEKKLPHLFIASCYAITQLLINVIVIKFLPQSTFTLVYIVLISFIIFSLIRLYIEGPTKFIKLKQ